MKRILIILIGTLGTMAVMAATPINYPPLGEKTLIAPFYFGPNAFPVPEMTDGSGSGELRAEIYADGHFGYAADKTATIGWKISLPLFTDRASLVVWMPMLEWWQNSERRMNECRLEDGRGRRGQGAGDVYVSTDIVVLREREKIPGITVRAAMRTASGGNYDLARYYDSPGYFFDAGIGKTFLLPHDWSIRVAGSAGFLCWQTDNGRQNDAVMYGLRFATGWKWLTLTTDYAGYAGWEAKGDRPMVLRGRLSGHIRGWEPYCTYQWGIKDYPWQSITLGLVYKFDVLGYIYKSKK